MNKGNVRGDFMSEQSEQVYRFMWQYVTAHEELPSQQQIAAALGFNKSEVSRSVSNLRESQQIEPRTLLPTAYHAWWRENLRSRWLCPA
jgi:predicted transcriptional regulator